MAPYIRVVTLIGKMPLIQEVYMIGADERRGRQHLLTRPSRLVTATADLLLPAAQEGRTLMELRLSCTSTLHLYPIGTQRQRIERARGVGDGKHGYRAL